MNDRTPATNFGAAAQSDAGQAAKRHNQCVPLPKTDDFTQHTLSITGFDSAMIADRQITFDTADFDKETQYGIDPAVDVVIRQPVNLVGNVVELYSHQYFFRDLGKILFPVESNMIHTV